MNKNIRVVVLLMLCVFSSNLCSCKNQTDDIKERFEKNSSDSNVVTVLDNCVFYFSDHTLDLRDLVNADEEPNNGYLFMDKTLYFSTTKETGAFEFSISVYRCDLYGRNKTLVFEKQGYKTHPWAVGKRDSLYFEHYISNAFDASARVIESYNINTGMYELAGTGETIALSNYEKDWEYDSQVDIPYVLALTEDCFDEALAGLDYSYSGCKVSLGRLFFIYRIEKSADSLYPHFVCEYVPETNEIHFISLFFAYDIEPFDVEVWQTTY